MTLLHVMSLLHKRCSSKLLLINILQQSFSDRPNRGLDRDIIFMMQLKGDLVQEIFFVIICLNNIIKQRNLCFLIRKMFKIIL